MADPLTPEPNAPLTPFVREFARVARLAAANPLRLMPADALAQLTLLAEPIATLLEVAPFERLRAAVANPAAARPRAAAAGRPQRLSEPGAASRSGAGTGAAIAPSRETPRSAMQLPTGSLTPAAAAASFPPAHQAPGRQAAPLITLAERRAALRRSAELVARPRLASPESASADAPTSIPAASSSAHEVNQQHAHQSVDGLSSDAAHQTQVSPFASRVLNREHQNALPGDEPGSRESGSESVHPLARLASPGQAGVTHEDQSPIGRSPANHEEATNTAPSVRVAGPSPGGIGSTSQATASTRASQHFPEVTSDADLADQLFETLYRDGVDLSWP